MSDPDRLVDSSESEVERLLLRAGRDGASLEARRRVLLAATGMVTASTLTSTGVAGATAAGKAAAGAKAASVLSLKWIAVIGLASVSAVAGTVAVRAAREDAPHQVAVRAADVEKGARRRAATAFAVRLPERAVEEPPSTPPVSSPTGAATTATPATAVAPMARIVPTGASHSTTARGEASGPPGASAAVELTMLDEARAAVTAGDPARALSVLDDYARRFPRGALGPEASVLRIVALVAAGDRPAAARVAQSFLQGHPNSPYAQRIESLLDSPNP